MHTLTVESLPKLSEELREHIDDPYAVFPHFMDDEQIERREAAEYIRYENFRVYVRSTPGMWEVYDGYVDVSVPAHSSEHEIFTAAVRRLGETSFRDRRGILDAWRLDSIERRPD